MSDKVLVIDDQSVTRRVVTFTLKSLNIEVIGAEDGSQAIQIASENHFVLVLVDINLPGLDGFEVVRELKKIPHLVDIPFIMFTARNHPGDEKTASEVGAAGFLYKPFSTQELRDLVIHHLNLE